MLNNLLGILPNASEHGIHIDQMLEFVHWIMLVLFVGWSIFFAYVLFRFHKSRNPTADYYGAKTKITTHVEVSVVMIEAVLLAGFAFPLWAKRVNQFPIQEAVRVHAIAQQFTWNFHFPGPDEKFGRQSIDLVSTSNQIGLDRTDPAAQDDIVISNEMHLPLKRPAIVEIMSKDVIHNFAIEQMRVSQDAIPGQKIPVWFTPVKSGVFEIVCGQLCGLGHYGMHATVSVDSEEDYKKWLQDMLALIPKPASGAQPAPATQPAPTTPATQPAPGAQPASPVRVHE